MKRKLKLLLLAIYVPIYIGAFFVVEKLVPGTADYWVSYCRLDDYIPFLEVFIIPYYMWYPMLFAVGIFLLLKDEDGYKKYMYSIMLGFTFTLVFCLIFPNGQDLRPTVFPRENFMTQMIQAIYDADTNTNVIPSVHAIGAFICGYALETTKALKSRLIKNLNWIVSMLVAMSTCFVKQHSILDIFAAVVLCAIIYAILYINIKNDEHLS
ncbi:PAP2 superfamily protein [Peptostreptococcaceae bacterium pGA-8]|nr:PAP2 superfamily protein [Peptostreptococcaceae bacterium pGA-8]